MRNEIFEKWVRGKTCEACAVFKKDVFCFVLGWSLMEDIEKSDISNFYLVHHLSDTEGVNKHQDRGAEFPGGSRRRLAVDHFFDELIMVSAGGNVFVHNSEGGKSEKMLTSDQIVSVRSIRYIGKNFYIAGGIRSVLRRKGPEEWEDISGDLDHELRPDQDSLSVGFEDVDGFSESDIYAVGGDGDAWHFNGKKWSIVDLPVNTEISCICCASNGMVYIGGVGHRILRGRGDHWEIVHEEENSNSIFKQIVEFEGRIFTVDEWGSTVYEVTNSCVVPVDTGEYGFAPTSCLCMAVGHGMLLVAGAEAASIFDGQSWRALFRSSEADDVSHVQSMLYETDKTLDELIEGLEE